MASSAMDSTLASTQPELTKIEKYEFLKRSKARNMIQKPKMRELVPNYAAVREEYNRATNSNINESSVKNLFSKLQGKFEPENRKPGGRKLGVPQGPKQGNKGGAKCHMKKPSKNLAANKSHQALVHSVEEKTVKRPTPVEEGHSSSSAVNVNEASRSIKHRKEGQARRTADGKGKGQNQHSWPKEEVYLLATVIGDRRIDFWDSVVDEMKARGSKMNATVMECRKMTTAFDDHEKAIAYTRLEKL
ncbi:MAG: hypothetical protein M1836_002322 [Candelina mexicana]|nr:MAG: hypothetical protein M1836_002322 [Candelina mexicana]